MSDTDHDLAALPGIGTLPAQTLRRVSELGRSLRIPADWTPIHQSEPADKAYLVLSGHLDVVRDGERVARLGPGSLAGEMGLVDHRLRNARLTTTDPVRVLAWTKEDFARLRRDLPDFDEHVRHVAQDRHHDNAS
ncbi:hypothetical protein ASG49_17415 [Marmoricola sp. Leaf446]|uniref:cyclic nucleotide-binding domain-containing protein n=1 Tax=Marmoricola sp. Leaf446 TaxID=1736379 RepID=UPI0006F68228|nr:cyclic nucleotide-binding domain-containing protein [Marmoricola sp. Leaf446]KQT89515.1 hypothetical protein ASG49_17415 [Marmoricola sp. Leaf446]